MKELLLVALFAISSSVNACVPGYDLVVTASQFLYTQGVATLLSEGGQVGNAIGSGIGSYLGSATGIMFSGDIGAAVGMEGGWLRRQANKVQSLPQEQRLGVAAGLLAAGYVVGKYGARYVLGLPL